MFQLSFKNNLNVFLELSAGQVRLNCCATLVIPPGTSVATIVTICCNHRDGEYFQHRITRKLGSTATSTLITRLLPLTNYISGAENETQRALLGHTNGNIEMRSPSAAAMLTMVAAATIVRFHPVYNCVMKSLFPGSLQWRHNDHDGVSNHQPRDCLFNRLFRRRSKKTPKLRVTALCAGNSPVTGEFPAQKASDTENVSICVVLTANLNLKQLSNWQGTNVNTIWFASPTTSYFPKHW